MVIHFTLQTNHNTNLKRHILSEHPDIQKCIENENEYKGKLERYGFGNPTQVVVNMSFSDILISVLKWVALDGRPFEIVNDEAFRHLVQPLMSAIAAKTRHSESIYVAKVRTLVHNVAKLMREKMRKLFKENGGFLSACLDGGEYNERKFMGIIAQCRNLNNIKEFNSFNIGTVELDQACTGSYLRWKMDDEFEKFGVKEEKIISVTTDGGSNYLSIAKKINDDRKKGTRKSSNFDELSDEDEDDEYTFEDMYVVVDEEEEDMLKEQFEIENLLLKSKFSCKAIAEELQTIIRLYPTFFFLCFRNFCQVQFTNFYFSCSLSSSSPTTGR